MGAHIEILLNAHLYILHVLKGVALDSTEPEDPARTPRLGAAARPGTQCRTRCGVIGHPMP
eukprot:766222-Hanusia_phi.AAC.1